MKDIFAFIGLVISEIPKALKKSQGKTMDRLLMSAVVSIALFGVLMVYNTSVPIAIRDFGDAHFFIKDQMLWLVIGIISLIFFSNIEYKFWYLFAVPILLVTLGLLIAVFFPIIGMNLYGASRWLNFGFFTVQPSELAKLAVCIYLAAWLSNREKGRFQAFVMFLGATVGLVLLQPDMGTSIILLVISLSVYFVSGAPLKQLATFIPIAVGLFVILAVITPYRLERLTTFINPNSDPLGSSYQIRQALLAIGSGGWTGVGFGKSRQKYEYLPEANTDAIFAIISEETGFIGALLVSGGYLFIIYKGFSIVKKAPDTFAKLLATGIVSWFGFQSAINIGAIVKLMPLTGVPLPLISYGGSSFIILMTAFGMLLNISRFQKK